MHMFAMIRRPGVYEAAAVAIFVGMVLLFAMQIAPSIVD
jgi:hypothetical protein